MKLKNVPNKIFLNIGYEPERGDDFNDLGEVTWCADKVNDNDIEYQRKPIWHDLKKKPNDLPKENTEVLIIVRRKYQNTFKEFCYLSRWVNQNWFNDVVLAWMDIPKFKD